MTSFNLFQFIFELHLIFCQVVTSTVEARNSRLSQEATRLATSVEDKLTDLQKELGFVEPTFPHSLLGITHLSFLALVDS